MSWIYILGVVVVLIALAALSGLRPDDTRRVSDTRLMAVARVVLALVLVLLVVRLVWSWIGS